MSFFSIRSYKLGFSGERAVELPQGARAVGFRFRGDIPHLIVIAPYSNKPQEMKSRRFQVVADNEPFQLDMELELLPRVEVIGSAAVVGKSAEIWHLIEHDPPVYTDRTVSVL